MNIMMIRSKLMRKVRMGVVMKVVIGNLGRRGIVRMRPGAKWTGVAIR